MRTEEAEAYIAILMKLIDPDVLTEEMKVIHVKVKKHQKMIADMRNALQDVIDKYTATNGRCIICGEMKHRVLCFVRKCEEAMRG